MDVNQFERSRRLVLEDAPGRSAEVGLLVPMEQKELGKAALGLTFRCLSSAHAQDPVAIGMFSISTHVPGRQGGVRPTSSTTAGRRP
jgi:hypothetical protein